MQNNQYQAQPYEPFGYSTPQNNVRPNIGSRQINGIAFAHQQARGIPRFLGDSAKKKDRVTGDGYYGNGLAGAWSEFIPLSFPQAPLVIVWYLGATTLKGGEIVDTSAQTISDGLSHSIFASSCTCTWDKDGITISGTSLNVGWPDLIIPEFYYMAMYDDSGVGSLGL